MTPEQKALARAASDPTDLPMLAAEAAVVGAMTDDDNLDALSRTVESLIAVTQGQAQSISDLDSRINSLALAVENLNSNVALLISRCAALEAQSPEAQQ